LDILVINCGSSSLKYQFFNMKTHEVLAKGLCERIGIDGGRIRHAAKGKPKYEQSVNMKSHAEAIRAVTKLMTSPEYGVIEDMNEIEAVGHRIVSGGEYFDRSVLVDDDSLRKIEICCELAPLHNPHHLTGIHACEEVMPGVPQVVTFDTAFHQTMPTEAYLYALPYEYYEKYKIRKQVTVCTGAI
jgi:acetate kinase